MNCMRNAERGDCKERVIMREDKRGDGMSRVCDEVINWMRGRYYQQSSEWRGGSVDRVCNPEKTGMSVRKSRGNKIAFNIPDKRPRRAKRARRRENMRVRCAVCNRSESANARATGERVTKNVMRTVKESH